MTVTQRSTRGLLMILPFLLAGCQTTVTGLADVEFQVIEDVTFAESLGIDLADFTRLETGVYIQDLVEGAGAVVEYGLSPEVEYTGWLANGEEFDSGLYTFLMGANQAIPGFEHGMLGMKEGGTRRFIIPPQLAYGARGSGPVPGGAVVIFEVVLNEVG